MNVTELFLLAMLAIFTLPWAVWRFGRTEYFAPLVVVQIVTGILLGPGIMGYFFPEIYTAVFTPQVIGSLNGIAWWGVSLFVFMAGVELDLNRVKHNTSETVATAGYALMVPLMVGALAASLLLLWPGFVGERAQTWQFVLGIGMASAVTALPILILFMEKLEILRQPIGQRILRYASLDDIAIWAVLAIILMDWTRLEQQGLFILAYVIIALGFRRLMPVMDKTDRIYVCLIWLAAVAWAADWCGLHFMVGAFLAGVVVDSENFDQEFLDRTRAAILLLMMPVFFLSTGLKTNWQMGGLAVLAAAALMFVAQLSGKLAGIYAAAKTLNWTKGEAALVGFLLQTKALIEIIFVNVLLDKGIITNQMFTVMLLMAIASTMLTIPVVTPMLRRLPHLVNKS